MPNNERGSAFEAMEEGNRVERCPKANAREPHPGGW